MMNPNIHLPNYPSKHLTTIVPALVYKQIYQPCVHICTSEELLCSVMYPCGTKETEWLCNVSSNDFFSFFKENHCQFLLCIVLSLLDCSQCISVFIGSIESGVCISNECLVLHVFL